MKIKLSKDIVASAKPAAKPYEIHDTDATGLLLRVQPSGHKSYIVVWSRGKRTTLGDATQLTLTAARVRTRRARSETDDHGAPLAVLEAAKPMPTIATLGEFMTIYRPHIEATAKAGKATADAIDAQFGYLFDQRMTAIDPAVFDKFKAGRLKAGRHPSTVNRDLDRIKAALSKAVEWKMMDSNPLLGTKRIKRGIDSRVRYLSSAESAALRAALAAREEAARERRASGNAWRSERGREALASIEGYSDHLMPMTLLALNTGLRRGELTQLTWADINLPQKLLTVRASAAKSGKERHIPLNTEALAVLRRYRQQHDKAGRLFNVVDIKKSWAGLMAAAGIDNFRFHDARHDFASRLVMRGVDLNTVRELLGHGDIATTLRYSHLAPEHRAAAVELLTG